MGRSAEESTSPWLGKNSAELTASEAPGGPPRVQRDKGHSCGPKDRMGTITHRSKSPSLPAPVRSWAEDHHGGGRSELGGS